MGLLEALRESRAKSGRDAFFVNSRASGPWQVGISIIASCVGGSATLGMARYGYTYCGATAFLNLVCKIIGYRRIFLRSFRKLFFVFFLRKLCIFF